ncbi:hypothetical protein U1Q18_008062 [Sarracenia purpurea var. burkii]
MMEGSSVQVITRKVTINTNKASAKGVFSTQEVADKGVSPLKPIKDKEGALRFKVRVGHPNHNQQTREEKGVKASKSTIFVDNLQDETRSQWLDRIF